MHMADALLSPGVGAAAWAASAGLLAYSAKKIRAQDDERIVPLMGVLGAFVFAAQMVNFAIPGTGSSGHIGGGLLLAILLGPYAAFTVLASVLTVQALLFADGGLLALGANIFNLGFFPCFVAYPLIFRPLVGANPSEKRLFVATVAAAVFGLQLGSLGVVLETWASGISSLPLASFLALMQPIHLAIGVGEGLATAGLVVFLRKMRPDLVNLGVVVGPSVNLRRVIGGFALATLLIGGVVSTFASGAPDGLEWSIERVAATELKVEGEVHAALANWQEKLAVMPDYAAPVSADGALAEHATALAGVLGGLATLAFVAALAWMLKRRRSHPQAR